MRSKTVSAASLTVASILSVISSLALVLGLAFSSFSSRPLLLSLQPLTLRTHSQSQTKALSITCIYCYDEIKGTQRQDFSCSFSDSLSDGEETIGLAPLANQSAKYSSVASADDEQESQATLTDEQEAFTTLFGAGTEDLKTTKDFSQHLADLKEQVKDVIQASKQDDRAGVDGTVHELRTRFDAGACGQLCICLC